MKDDHSGHHSRFLKLGWELAYKKPRGQILGRLNHPRSFCRVLSVTPTGRLRVPKAQRPRPGTHRAERSLSGVMRRRVKDAWDP